jgi:hypothetical protein
VKKSILVKAALVVLGAIVGYIVITKLLAFILGTLIFKIVLPLVIIGAIGYVGYRYVTRNALPGRRRSSLP